jgi:hypothetical protein
MIRRSVPIVVSPNCLFRRFDNVVIVSSGKRFRLDSLHILCTATELVSREVLRLLGHVQLIPLPSFHKCFLIFLHAEGSILCLYHVILPRGGCSSPSS